jgi:hypothetical protein
MSDSRDFVRSTVHRLRVGVGAIRPAVAEACVGPACRLRRLFVGPARVSLRGVLPGLPVDWRGLCGACWLMSIPTAGGRSRRHFNT